VCEREMGSGVPTSSDATCRCASTAACRHASDAARRHRVDLCHRAPCHHSPRPALHAATAARLHATAPDTAPPHAATPRERGRGRRPWRETRGARRREGGEVSEGGREKSAQPGCWRKGAAGEVEKRGSRSVPEPMKP
jgi:hypothetical protein